MSSTSVQRVRPPRSTAGFPGRRVEGWGLVESDRPNLHAVPDSDPGSGASRFPAHLMHAAATLYYLEDATQAEVARRLDTSRATVSRLLSEARRLGIVRIQVVDPADALRDDELGPRAAEALGLAAVHVAPAAHEAVLGSALAQPLAHALGGVGLQPDDVLLVSSGRTVWEASRQTLPDLPGVVVAPTVGGQDEPEAWYQTNEITRSVAEKIGGRPVFLYAPAQPGQDLYDRLVDDPATRRVLELWKTAKCALLGVGAPPHTRRSMANFLPRDADWLRDAVGDICYRFFDSAGGPLHFPGEERLIATSLETLRTIPVTIAIAVGESKIPSILAGARSGWFNTLVTDAPTAAALLDAAT
ncbi:MAG: RNA polymerase subunit sigma-70 [Nocardioidaceae bacterium]|nr:RNA polymerase subunit sigma-70 [Nocardioidaceae bacterium]